FVPNIGLALIAGQAADRFDRRMIVAAALAVQALCLAAFAGWAAAAAPAAGPVYLLLVVVGAARAFASPALVSLLPRVVGGAVFPGPVAAPPAAFQACRIAGPAVGGVVYALAGGPATFAAAAGLYVLTIVQTRRLVGGRSSAPPVAAHADDKSV